MAGRQEPRPVESSSAAEQQSTKAWDIGARGEERPGRQLDQLACETLRLLHDRRIPGGRANIDHLAVTRTGIYVIDAKKYKGRPQLKIEGGFIGPRHHSRSTRLVAQEALPPGAGCRASHSRSRRGYPPEARARPGSGLIGSRGIPRSASDVGHSRDTAVASPRHVPCDLTWATRRAFGLALKAAARQKLAAGQGGRGWGTCGTPWSAACTRFGKSSDREHHRR